MESGFNIEGAFLMGRDFFNNVVGRQSLFFNEIANLRPATLLKKRLWRTATLSKKRLWHRCFPMNFAKFFRTPFLTEHIRWLLLTC